MNEQRKVIYGRRQQVIDGEDIHDSTIVLIEEVLTNVVDDRLEGEFAEGWDLHQLVAELVNYYPTTLNAEALAEYQDRDDILGLVIDEAVGQYEKKCEEYPGGMDTAKEIERDVMLQILDQRWREHLSDMDYLRDGIHLRQIAQTDPLTAWQKEGYLMFEALLGNVDADFVRYITHVEMSAVEAIEEAVEADDGLQGAVTNANVVAPGATELPAHGNASHEEGAAQTGRQDRAQRAVLVRFGPQVQAVPWPTLRPRTPFAKPSEPWRTSSRGGRRRAST